MDDRQQPHESFGPRDDARASVVAEAGAGTLVVRPLEPADHDDLYAIFDEVVASGAGYPQAPPLTQDVFESTWVTSPTLTVVAAGEATGHVLGAYYLKPNFVGRAAHIANAGYVVDRGHRGRGVGRVLVADSIWRAPLVGFDAVMFNLVFASNPAGRLYEYLGWREIGRIPAAVEGEDAVIYWRRV